jgi:hypothetical protein
MRNRSSLRWGLLGLGLSLCIGAVLPAPTRADSVALSLEGLPTTSITAGSTGNFDVVLTNTGSSEITVGGFNFELVVPAASGVIFTDANTSTTGPYIFAGNSLFGPDLTGTVSTTDLIVSDVVALPGSGTDLGAGDSIDIGNLSFGVSSSAPTETVNIGFGSSNDVSDNNGNSIPITEASGGILSITGTNAVPEPSSVALLLCGLLALWLIRQRALGKGDC